MNAKIYNGNVQPNPKEYKIWVNDEGIIKTWNGTEWVEQSGGSGESGGSGSGSDSKYLPKYYSIDWSVADEDWTIVLEDGNRNRIASTIKGSFLIAAYIPPLEIKAFSFLPVGFSNQNTIDGNCFETLESVIDYINRQTDFSISMNGIKEISEEEYYSFDNNSLE